MVRRDDISEVTPYLVRPEGELRKLTAPGPTLGGRGERDQKLREELLPPIKVTRPISEITLPPPPPPLRIDRIDTYWYKPQITYNTRSSDSFLETGAETLCLECNRKQCTMEDRYSVSQECQECKVAQNNIKRLSILVLIFVVTTLGLVLVITCQLENQANGIQTD